MLKPTDKDGILSRHARYELLRVPAAKRYWPRPALVSTAFDVEGIGYRREAAQRFARAAMKCEAANRYYGVVATREPNNPHDTNAIMVIGNWVQRGWFGGEKTRTVHVGYVPADLAKDIVEAYGPTRDPELSLYEIYLGAGGFVNIKVIALRPE